jgi:penicillin-binding protein 2
MNPEKTRSRVFSRRAALVLGAQVLAMGGLGARLYYLQVVESDRYAMLAEENRINFRLIAPPRGVIVDRNETPLAVNVQNYRVVLVPEQAENAGGVSAVLRKLAALIDLDDRDIGRVQREAERRLPFVPINVAENLTWEEVSRIGVNQPDLPGVSIDVGQTRHYPYADTTAHVLGYVSAVSEKDLTGDPVLELPGFRIGKNGIEKHYDLALRGTAGTSKVEVNAVGRVIREIDRQEGQSGREVRLTLDQRLQSFTAARLAGEKAASAVVMDVHSGDVLALASVPSFDPNAFSEGIGAREWQALVTNPYGPLTNKAVGGQYAPGSTFKMAVALAALENGIPVDHNVFCPGHMELGDRRFHCWKRHGHGAMNMISAISESCDVWFYDVARRVGVDRIAEVSRRLGLGARTGLELIGERPGLIPTRQWKRDARGQPWHMGETLVVGIGQGYVLTTPLQLAVMTARLVNGGKAVLPRLTYPVAGFTSGRRTPAGGARGRAGRRRRSGRGRPGRRDGGRRFDRADPGSRRPTFRRPGVQTRASRDHETGHVRGRERRTRHGEQFPAATGRLHDERQDRDQPSAPHQPGGAGGGHSIRRGHRLAAARSRVVRRLRADPRSALRRVRHRGTRRRRRAGGRAGRAGRPGGSSAAARFRHGGNARSEPRRTGNPGGRLMSLGLAEWRQPEMTLGQRIWNINWPMWILVGLCVAVGLAMQYSAANGSWDPWAKRQLILYSVFAVGMLVLAVIDIRIVLRGAYLFYGVVFLLLVFVEFNGASGKGAVRWIEVPGLGQKFQPSELMKFALVLALARYFHKLSHEDVGRIGYLLIPILMVAAPMVLVLRQPDLGTAVTLGAGGVVIFLLAGVRWWKFAFVGLSGLIASPFIWGMLHEYQQRRILVLLDPESDPLGAGYHILQSKIAMARAACIGGRVSRRHRRATLNFLPEKADRLHFHHAGRRVRPLGAVGLMRCTAC